MSNFYFEPINKFMTAKVVELQIGKEALSWDISRQRDIGLFPAVREDSPQGFNEFTQEKVNPVWTKYNDKSEFSYYSGEIGDIPDGPIYLQEWTIQNKATPDTDGAVWIVQVEKQRRLSEVNGYILEAAATERELHPDMQVYIDKIKNINNQNGYPFAIAEAIKQGYAASYFGTLPTQTDIFSGNTGTLPFSAYSKTEIDAMTFGGGGGASELSGLSDVDTAGVVDGNFLSYNAANSQFEATNDLQVKSLELDTVDPSIAGTEIAGAQADWDITPVQLSPKVSLARMMGGGHLINLKADVTNGSSWGQLGYNMDNDVDWSIQGWTGDVTAHSDYSYEMDDHFDLDPNDSTTVEADVTGAEWVMHDTNSDRYWKFDFTAWTPWEDNIANAFDNPPGFSYTRTEYSDPTTGTLDPATEVTHTVTGWADSDVVDVLIAGTSTDTNLSIHRGFDRGLGNPLSDGPDGSLYDQVNSVDFEFPFNTEWAVVNAYSDVLDPNLKYSKDFDAATGNGSVTVGMKMVCHTLDNDKYFGFTFTGWSDQNDGSGWAADIAELDTSIKTGVIFADGTVQTTLGGDVSYNRDVFDSQMNNQSNLAPMVFNHCEGVTITTDQNPVIDYNSFADPKQVAVRSPYGLQSYNTIYNTVDTRLRAPVLSSNTIDSSDIRVYNGVYTTYNSYYTVSWYAGYNDISRRTSAGFRRATFGTVNMAKIAAPSFLDANNIYYGTYQTELRLNNTNGSDTLSVEFENNHVDLNGHTLPVLTFGQSAIINLHTVDMGSGVVKRYISDIILF